MLQREDHPEPDTDPVPGELRDPAGELRDRQALHNWGIT